MVGSIWVISAHTLIKCRSNLDLGFFPFLHREVLLFKVPLRVSSKVDVNSKSTLCLQVFPSEQIESCVYSSLRIRKHGEKCSGKKRSKIPNYCQGGSGWLWIVCIKKFLYLCSLICSTDCGPCSDEHPPNVFLAMRRCLNLGLGGEWGDSATNVGGYSQEPSEKGTGQTSYICSHCTLAYQSTSIFVSKTGRCALSMSNILSSSTS